MTTSIEVFRRNVAHRIKADGTSRTAVAKRAGMERANLAKLLNSDSANPTLALCDRIAKALGTTVHELLKAKGKTNGKRSRAKS